MEIKLVGRVGVVRTNQYDDQYVLNFSIAEASEFGTLWVSCALWSEERVDGIRVGDLVSVEGRLKPSRDGGPRIFFGKDGKPRSSYEVVVENWRVKGHSAKRKALPNSVSPIPTPDPAEAEADDISIEEVWS